MSTQTRTILRVCFWVALAVVTVPTAMLGAHVHAFPEWWAERFIVKDFLAEQDAHWAHKWNVQNQHTEMRAFNAQLESLVIEMQAKAERERQEADRAYRESRR